MEIADEVMDGEIRPADEFVLSLFREKNDLTNPIGSIYVEKAARDITSLGSYSIVGLISASTIGLLLLLKERAAALFSFLAVTSGVALVQFLKIGFDRPRPELVSHFVEVSTRSFPSGHSTIGFVVYLSLALLACKALPSTRSKTFVIGLSIFTASLVAISRIYLGVHWPSDVLAGALLGTFWSLLWLAIEQYFEKNSTTEIR